MSSFYKAQAILDDQPVIDSILFSCLMSGCEECALLTVKIKRLKCDIEKLTQQSIKYTRREQAIKAHLRLLEWQLSYEQAEALKF